MDFSVAKGAVTLPRPADPRAFQKAVAARLSAVFGEKCVEEWPAFTEENRHYAPRLDIAVGPFSTTPGVRLVDDYDRLADHHHDLLRSLWECHASNIQRVPDVDPPLTFEDAAGANPNARCFLAIEIENAVSRKHLMGGIINAVALGRFAVIIGWNDKMLRALIQARRYLRALTTVDKPTVRVGNAFILSPDQLVQVLDEANGR